MKHIKRINESEENILTWNKIINDPNVDFISDRKVKDVYSRRSCLWGVKDNQLNDPIDLSSPKDLRRGVLWFKTTNNNIKLYANFNLSLVLVFKNGDLFAVLNIYELHGCGFFKDIVVIHGHENIILYDTQDFTFKNIGTR